MLKNNTKTNIRGCILGTLFELNCSWKSQLKCFEPKSLTFFTNMEQQQAQIHCMATFSNIYDKDCDTDKVF